MSKKYNLPNVFELNLKYFVFLISWFLCLVLPHFQNDFNFLIISLEVLICILIFSSLYQIFAITQSAQSFMQPTIILLIPISYLISVAFVFFGRNELYILLNRFGAGTMYVQDKIYIFGDLAHLTSASGCQTPLQIGWNICDPFQRPFNQNPHIVEVLNLVNFSNTLGIGLISTVVFYTLAIVVAYKEQVKPLTLFLTLLSPPFVLAIDRGNEIITITLILLGLHFITKKGIRNLVGALLIGLSCLFKLWPIVLLISLMVLLWNKLPIISRLFMTLPIIYWMINFQNAFNMLEFTDKGSPLGLSFGFQYYLNSSIPTQFLLVFIVLTLLFFTYFILKNVSLHKELSELSTSPHILNSLLITYVATWAFGQSYIYRLVVMLPILLYIIKVFDKSKNRIFLEVFIVVTLLTSKLVITTILTSSLALIFSFIILSQLISWVSKFRQRIKFI